MNTSTRELLEALKLHQACGRCAERKIPLSKRRVVLADENHNFVVHLAADDVKAWAKDLLAIQSRKPGSKAPPYKLPSGMVLYGASNAEQPDSCHKLMSRRFDPDA